MTTQQEIRENFNPRSPHGERRTHHIASATERQISIHAPRTGSDVRAGSKEALEEISIHAPRTGSDAIRASMANLDLFQSTLPARGAT